MQNIEKYCTITGGKICFATVVWDLHHTAWGHFASATYWTYSPALLAFLGDTIFIFCSMVIRVKQLLSLWSVRNQAATQGCNCFAANHKLWWFFLQESSYPKFVLFVLKIGLKTIFKGWRQIICNYLLKIFKNRFSVHFTTKKKLKWKIHYLCY